MNLDRDKKINVDENSVVFFTIGCPECKKKGCGFCNGTGSINFYPSPSAHDYIKIAIAKYRIDKKY